MPFKVPPDDVVADPPAAEDCVDVAAGWDELVGELDEFEPQAATPRAASTSSAAANRWALLLIAFMIIAPRSLLREKPGLRSRRLTRNCCSRTLTMRGERLRKSPPWGAVGLFGRSERIEPCSP
jgi:hypothetical protein